MAESSRPDLGWRDKPGASQPYNPIVGVTSAAYLRALLRVNSIAI